MKKFFSLIAAVLFAGSMMATEVTVSKTVEELATANSWANGTVVTPFALDEVITVSTDATDANTGKYYTSGQQVRLYQSGAAKLIISAAEGYTISSITVEYVSEKGGIFAETASGVAVPYENVQSATFTVANSGEATNGQARVTAISVTYNGEGGVTPPPADTYTVAGSDAAIFGESWNPALATNDMTLANGVYTWEKAELNLTAGDIEFKVVKNHSWDIAYPAQNYVLNIAEDGEYTITITFDPSNEAVAAEAVKNEPLADPTNCAEAAAAALSVSANNELYNNGAVYTIEGYVTGIKTAYSDQYHNISFWMADAADGGEVLQAYRAACASEADAPKVGDKVAVTGTLTKYGTTPEFAAACTYVILERATPVEGDTIVIDIESEVQYVDYVAEAGWWQFMAENDVYSISISNVSTTQAAGVYTVADLDADYTYIEIKATEAEVHFVDGSLTLTEGEDGSRAIEGVVTGDDDKIYSIKLVFRIPTPETTVNVEIPNWGVMDAAEIYSYTGTLFYGEAADSTYIQFVVLGNNPIGTFTYDDMLPTATGIEVGGDYKPIYSMDVTVNASDAQRAIITMDILCYNNTLYHVTTTIGEGINNVEDAVKAIKRIVNGQVVIEKAGKSYNMNGAVIR